MLWKGWNSQKWNCSASTAFSVSKGLRCKRHGDPPNGVKKRNARSVPGPKQVLLGDVAGVFFVIGGYIPIACQRQPVRYYSLVRHRM